MGHGHADLGRDAQVEADTDGDGLLTVLQDLDWDTDGELAAVSTSGEDAGGDEGVLAGEAEYVYTAGGERLIRTDADGTTVFLPGGQEVTVTDGAVSAVRYYSFGGQMVAVRDRNGLGGVTSLVCDHQGSVTAAVPNTDWTPDAVTRVYTDPFGADRTPDATDTTTGETTAGLDGLPGDRRWLAAAGGVDDTATGFVLLGARYYDPALGRFLSVDPLLDLSTPAHQDAYGYGYQNPATFSDPSGQLPIGGGHTGVTVGWGDDAEMTPAEAARAVSTGPANGSSGGNSTTAEVKTVVHIYTGDGDIPIDGLPAGTYMPDDIRKGMLDSFGSTPGYEWLYDTIPVTPACTIDTPVWQSCHMGNDEQILDFIYTLFVEDYVNCANGEITGCVWIAVGFIPGGKVLKAGEAVIDVAKYADEVADAASTGVRLSDEYAHLVTQHVTNSGETVLGHQGYIEKAQSRGASYFDVGDEWNKIESRGGDPWELNEAFLDNRIAAGDSMILSVSKQDVRPGSYLEREISYLRANGYVWVNQWALRPKG